MDSGSFLATIGISGKTNQLHLWDILLPDHEALVEKAVFKKDSEPSVLAYSQRYQNLFIGSKSGEISVYDVRKAQFLSVFTAHQGCITTLSIDFSEEFFVSGGIDGYTKIWNIKTFEPLYMFPNKETKKIGITNSELISSFLYCSDEGGRVFRRTAI